MEITIITHTIIIISLMVVVGMVISKTFKFNKYTHEMLISLIVNVGMPSIILSSILKVEIEKDMYSMLIFTFIFSIIVNIVGIGLGVVISIVLKRYSNFRQEIGVLSGIGNTGYIGIPLCSILLGPEGALYAAIFDAGVDVTLWTVGAFVLQGSPQKISSRTLLHMINVPFVTVIIGVFILFFQIRFPSIIVSLLQDLSGLAAPLAMLYIGILIASIKKPHKEDLYASWIPISIKLVILPVLVTTFIFSFFNEYHVSKYVIIIQTMMPSLALASVLFAKYSRNQSLGVITIALSTLLSLITIPLLLYFISAHLDFN